MRGGCIKLIQTKGKLNMNLSQIKKISIILTLIIIAHLIFQMFLPFMSVECMSKQYESSAFNVKKRETKTVKANVIDRSSISEIAEIVDQVISIKREMNTINKFDTNEYELFSEIISRYRLQKIKLESKIQEWNMKYEYKLDQSLIDHIEDFSYDKEFIVEKEDYKEVQDNEVINFFDSITIIKNDISTIYFIEVRDSKNNKSIFTDSLNINERETKYNGEILNKVLYEYGEKKAKDNQVTLPISIIVSSQDKIISKRKFLYKQEYPPNQSYASYIPEDEHPIETDTFVLQKKFDSLQTLFEKKRKSPPYILFKLVISKSTSSVPKDISHAQSIRDSLEDMIRSYNVADSSLELLKEVLLQYFIASDKYDKSINDWTDIHGEGFPEEITYSQFCISEQDEWYIERDKLLSFDLIGIGKNVELEIREKGVNAPFITYSLGDIDGEVSIDVLEFNRDLLSYLVEESSIYNSQYFTDIEIVAKRNGKLISKFTLTVRATVG